MGTHGNSISTSIEEKNILRLPGTDRCLPLGVTNYFDASRDTVTPRILFVGYIIVEKFGSNYYRILHENFEKF